MTTSFRANQIIGEVLPGDYTADGIKWRVSKTGLERRRISRFDEEYLRADMSASCSAGGQRFTVKVRGSVNHPDMPWRTACEFGYVSLFAGSDKVAYWSGFSGGGDITLDGLNSRLDKIDERAIEIAASGLSAIDAARGAWDAADSLKAAKREAERSAKQSQQEAERRDRIGSALDRFRK
jgi:hypothetical protein